MAYGISGLGRSAEHTWALFCDWCAASDRSSLPATPSTLAEFLDHHPAAVATQRRRVSAVNAAHRSRGMAEPGRSVPIRLALAERRRERLTEIRGCAASIIDGILSSGWPYGLFGRRDALILTLVSAGLTYRDISTLRRGDIEVAGPDLIVSGLHRVTPTMLGSYGESGPVSVYRRWAQLQSMFDRSASISMLREFLDPDRSPSMSASPVVTAQHAEEPLVVRIDRWGYTPWTPEPLTVQSLSALTRAHLNGRPAAHRPRTLWTTNDPDSAVLHGAEPGRSGFVLDNAYYEHGIRARRDAHIRLAELDDRFDDINDRVDDLLRTLVDILDEHDGWDRGDC
ncbi:MULTISPECIES: hypothetical protein [Gordonia]|uniref:Recombinase n=2 Tax=Gordonia TaxID=2053 RepID=L7LPS1_9ACTN|nr:MULTISPECIES: hypothetical protein [Gordonia]WFN92566.1 recombinase [Gordonia sihwensis]GAC62756.1 hypothetical protein GSI01S_42_00150 [Gordonia sihwensis NBRC 108236]